MRPRGAGAGRGVVNPLGSVPNRDLAGRETRGHLGDEKRGQLLESRLKKQSMGLLDAGQASHAHANNHSNHVLIVRRDR